jgi:hypothetical protein
MSQSDYIRYKKTTNQLKEIKKLDPILASQDYTTFKQYTLESTIQNTSPTLNRLALPGYRYIFEMERKISNCPITNFKMCNLTNNRLNRKLNTIDSLLPAPLLNQHPTKTIV